jgi:hypothetical protein
MEAVADCTKAHVGLFLVGILVPKIVKFRYHGDPGQEEEPPVGMRPLLLNQHYFRGGRPGGSFNGSCQGGGSGSVPG